MSDGLESGVFRLERPFCSYPQDMAYNEYLGCLEQAVYGFLNQWKKSSYPSVAAIKAAVSRKGSGKRKARPVSRELIRHAIDALEEEGYVKRLKRGNKQTNLYVLDERGELNKYTTEQVREIVFGGGSDCKDPCNPPKSDCKDPCSQGGGSDCKDPCTNINININTDEKKKVGGLQVASDEATSNDPEPETLAEQKPEAAALARHLEQQILDHINTHDLSFSKPNCTDTWIADMDKLIRLGTTDPDVKSEPVEPEKVRRVIDKLFEWFGEPTGNSDFCWANNVRSPKKLRRQWPRLVADLETERRRRAGGHGRRPVVNNLGISEDDRQQFIKAAALKLREKDRGAQSVGTTKPEPVAVLASIGGGS